MKNWSQAPHELAIVLTATIVPNSVDSAAASPETRLHEYARSVDFYKRFGRVFFLENSNYKIESHLESFGGAEFNLRRLPCSAQPARGKGYQEFEMIDAWLNSEPDLPAKWLKITGRYRVLNISTVLTECLRRNETSLLIDQVPRARVARTHLFCVNTSFYKSRMAGLYAQCDDRTGDWIERVLFRKLQTCPRSDISSFVTQPRISAVAGSTGASFPTGRTQWAFKQGLRWVNRLFDRRYLWYAK